MLRRQGYTIVELLVVVVVIVILLGVAVYPSLEVLPKSRDTERMNDTASIARRLEQAYSAQEVGAPAYPTTTKLLSDIATKSGTVSRLDADALNAPDASSSSVVAATSNTSEPRGAGSPVLGQYVYQPLNSSGALCTGTDTCIRFFIYYRTEHDSTVKIIKSLHQQ